MIVEVVLGAANCYNVCMHVVFSWGWHDTTFKGWFTLTQSLTQHPISVRWQQINIRYVLFHPQAMTFSDKYIYNARPSTLKFATWSNLLNLYLSLMWLIGLARGSVNGFGKISLLDLHCVVWSWWTSNMSSERSWQCDLYPSL